MTTLNRSRRTQYLVDALGVAAVVVYAALGLWQCVRCAVALWGMR